MSKFKLPILLFVFCAFLSLTVAANEKLFVATPLTKPGEFTPGIEGPACDANGNIFAVNFKSQQRIGRVTPDGKGEVFVNLPKKSVGNGIRFDRFYAGASVCTPTRGTVITGRTSGRNGAAGLHQRLCLQEKTLPRALKKAGYSNVAVENTATVLSPIS